MTTLFKFNIRIFNTSNQYIHSIIEIEKSGISYFFNKQINSLELRCYNRYKLKYEGIYYGYRTSKWYKERMNIKVFHVNNYWYSIIKWDKDDIKSEEYICN